MHGCSTARINWPHVSPEMARPNQSIIEETDTAFTIGWKGRYRIDGPAFVYSDRESGRVVTILGYPTDKIADTA